jgi:hypothetical protein
MRLDDWSRDGRYMIEMRRDPKTSDDIWILPLFGDKKPFPYVNSEARESDARLSPNSEWLAYTSDESKQPEIYVQTFPEPRGKWQVSANGGSHAAWSRDGKELYFVAPDAKMMAVEIKSGPTLDHGVPKPLFDTRLDPLSTPDDFIRYDVSKDGRFLIATPLEHAANVPLTLWVNWTAGLKK